MTPVAKLLIVAASANLVGCATVPAPQVNDRLPYVAILRPPPHGEPDIFLTAAFDTHIWIDSNCVLMGNRRAGYHLPLFFRGTQVGRDRAGLFLREVETGRKFRNGDRVKGGGGGSPFTGHELDAVLAKPVPDACIARVNGSAGSVNPGMRPG